MEKSIKKNIWRFNSKNVKHLKLLNFIVRWKFVDMQMLKQYYKVSQPALLKLMNVFSRTGLVVQKYVSNNNNKGGKISVYFATTKACHILNKSYLNRLNFIVDVSDNEIQDIINQWISLSPETNKATIDKTSKQQIIIQEVSGAKTIVSYENFLQKVLPLIFTNNPNLTSGATTLPNYVVLSKLQHSKDCLSLINKLGLKDNQYLTEIELLSRYLRLKKSLNMTSRPRLCDFAYFDYQNRLIGVEVERFMKAKDKYVSGEFKNNLSLTTDIADYGTIANPIKIHWGYFDNEYQSWTLVPEFDGFSAAKVELNKHLFGNKSFKTITNYEISLSNGSNDSIWATSQKEAKLLIVKKWQQIDQSVKILGISSVKGDDCIFKRIYYSINHKFYSQVHWYMPKNELARFKAFLIGPSLNKQIPVYETGLPDFIKIFDYDAVSSQIGFYPDDLKELNMRKSLIARAKNLSDKEKVQKFNELLKLEHDENAYSLFYILHQILK